MNRGVVIIGGGFAGLAAAVHLSDNGLPLTLLERRSFLGGRAYSFRDRTTGDTIDNGQHLMMGCYHQTLDFLRKIGADGRLKFQPSPRVDFLEIVSGESRHSSFKCPPLPAPLHLLAGLMGLGTLGWADRLGALKVGLALRKLRGDGEALSDLTVREWLSSLGQSAAMQKKFWDPMALATLNESPDIASADMFARVLRQGFLQTRDDSAMVVSRVGLSDLYTESAREYIEKRGGKVRLNADVVSMRFDGRRVSSLLLRGGEEIIPATVVSALPCFALRRVVPEEVVESSRSLGSLGLFRPAPIVSINVWYPEPVTDVEFVGLLDSRIDWVFNRDAISGNPSKRPQHLALVISGAHSVSSLSKEAIRDLAVEELRRFFPSARPQRPLHTFVVREHEATISHTTGLARLRPGCRTEFENLFLAGDWTATGLPATIESAVQSGRACADAILYQSGLN